MELLWQLMIIKLQNLWEEQINFSDIQWHINMKMNYLKQCLQILNGILQRQV